MMNRKNCLKMENSFLSSSSLLDFYGELGEKNMSSSLGFMDLLNHDFGPISSLFHAHDSHDQSHHVMTTTTTSSEVFNAPSTPNYSSISSESITAGHGGHENDHHQHMMTTKQDHEEEQNNKTTSNKRLKAKKTVSEKKKEKKKKEREPRFAFMTKSEVDHLEDGFRWRKYGQKAVKNSPFPRGYYRCTTASCNVKKRVERSSTDPSFVVTTYEGQHTHTSPSPSILLPRYSSPIAATVLPPYSSGGGRPFPAPGQMQPHEPHFDFSIPLSCGYNMGYTKNALNSAGANQHELHFRNNPTSSAALLADYGLLQDIVPSSVIKKED